MPAEELDALTAGFDPLIEARELSVADKRRLQAHLAQQREVAEAEDQQRQTPPPEVMSAASSARLKPRPSPTAAFGALLVLWPRPSSAPKGAGSPSCPAEPATACNPPATTQRPLWAVGTTRKFTIRHMEFQGSAGVGVWRLEEIKPLLNPDLPKPDLQKIIATWPIARARNASLTNHPWNGGVSMNESD